MNYEEGVITVNYSPDAAIEFWFDARAAKSNCSSHSYPRQQKRPQYQRLLWILTN